MVALITVLVLLAVMFGWIAGQTYTHIQMQRTFEIGDMVRVKSKPEDQILQRMMSRGFVNVLAKAVMGKRGVIIETSADARVARIKFIDAGSHLSAYHIPHNVLELDKKNAVAPTQGCKAVQSNSQPLGRSPVSSNEEAKS